MAPDNLNIHNTENHSDNDSQQHGHIQGGHGDVVLHVTSKCVCTFEFKLSISYQEGTLIIEGNLEPNS